MPNVVSRTDRDLRKSEPLRCCRSSQKNTPSRTTHSGWLLSRAAVTSSKQHYIEILCKRMSWIVAQTIVRQLVSVVKTSI